MIFKTRKPKRNHHAPGFGPGFLFAKKGAKHRGRGRRAAEAQSEARDAKRGRPQKGCEAPRASTPRSGSAARSPQPEGERAAKKGAKHRGRARRAAEAPSEARDAKRGGPPKRVRSTEGEHAAQRKRSPKPATRRGAGRQKGCEAPRTRTALKELPQSEARDAKRGRPQKGCEAHNPQGNGLSEGFLHSLSLKNKLRIDNGTLWI